MYQRVVSPYAHRLTHHGATGTPTPLTTKLQQEHTHYY
jgi:hypothetical protein